MRCYVYHVYFNKYLGGVIVDSVGPSVVNPRSGSNHSWLNRAFPHPVSKEYGLIFIVANFA